MKNLLLISIALLVSSSNAYASDDLNSHEQFETGPLPEIINYDPEFRPPMPMPQLQPGALSDDEEYDHLSRPTYDINYDNDQYK